MNLIKNTKLTKTLFNILTITLAIMSFLTVYCNYLKINNNQIYYENLFRQLRSSALLNNDSVEQYKIDMSTAEKPLYSTGKECAIKGFQSYLDSTGFTIEGFGECITEVPVAGTYQVKMYQRAGKWSDGLIFNELNCYQVKGNKTFNDKTDSKQSYCLKGERFNRETKDVNYNSSTGIINSTYTNEYQKVENYELVQPLCYKFTNESITKVDYYNVRYDKNGKIINYEVSLTLNSLGVQDYAKAIYTAGELAKMPEFQEEKIAMIIDRDGKLITFKVCESYKVTKKVPVLGNQSTVLTNNMTFRIFNYNQNPDSSFLKKPI